MPLPNKSLKMIFIFLGIAALFGAFLIIYGLRLSLYKHPADYAEATVTVKPGATSTGVNLETGLSANKPLNQPRISGGNTVAVEGWTFNVDLANTAAKRIQGLSGRPKLADNEGMLFLFPTSTRQSFWMKDMQFPLDMIWIKGDTVVGVAANAPAPAPGTSILNLPQYVSPEPVDKVLEINAGLAAKYGIGKGDTVTINLAKNTKPQD